MKDRAEAYVVLKATGKGNNLVEKHRKEWRFNLLNTAEREAFFLEIEDYVLGIASKERRGE
jgi:hypothetical protein